MRIVSLCPSLTELVFDLGRGVDLVGITEYCVHPEAGVAAIEKVGGTKTPDVSRIAELAPDIVLLNEEENRREDAQLLQAAGLNCQSSLPRDCAGTATMVRQIARALEREEEGERIASDIELRAQRVCSAAVGEPEVRWVYLIWRKPWMSVNADTFAHSLLNQAGGTNVFGERDERYPEVDVAQIAHGNPRVVFLCTEPFPFARKHVVELARLTGMSEERFRIVDGEYLSWHGSRTPEGIDYAESLIADARR